jgi:hydroxymethylpyrimidine/phosphomethylpyrimidine kinase
MLSAAIASGLATQNALAESISQAKAFVLKRIASNDSRLSWYTERTSH